ncbi:MAG: hypothetical protein ABI758_07105 [Candidatus Woesebacteria bacterium]
MPSHLENNSFLSDSQEPIIPLGNPVYGYCNPPDGMYATLGVFPAGHRRLISSEPYKHIVSITDQIDQTSVLASDFLPKHLASFYPYVPRKMIQSCDDWDCGAFAFLFNDGLLLHQFLRTSAYEVLHSGREYVSKAYTQLEEAPVYGDLIWIDIALKLEKSVLERHHCCTYITESTKGPLVFSKNGTGPTVPYLLYTLNEVVDNYSMHGDILPLKRYRLRT